MSSPNYIYNTLGVLGTGSTIDDISLIVSGRSTMDRLDAHKTLSFQVRVSDTLLIGHEDLTPSVSNYGKLFISGASQGDNLLRVDDYSGSTQFMVRPEGQITIRNNQSSIIISSYAPDNGSVENMMEGEHNVAIGFGAGSASNQEEGVFIGMEAGQKAATVSAPIFIGARAGEDYISGSFPIGLGSNSLRNNTGSNVIGLGATTARYNSGSLVTAFGTSAGSNNGGSNVLLVGNNAGAAQSGSSVMAVGSAAGRYNTGDNVVAIGGSAADGNIGNNSNFFGASAGIANSGGTVNLFGNATGAYNSGSRNNFFGEDAGLLSKGSSSFLMGYRAGRELHGDHVIAIGDQALQLGGGERVIAIGGSTLRFINGDDNIIVGQNITSYTTASTIVFNGSAVETDNQTINLPSHGLGVAGEFVVLEYRQGSEPIGITSGGALKYEIIDADNIKLNEQGGQRIDSYTAEVGTDHILNTINTWSGVTILGHGYGYPTAENHVYIGGGSQTGVTFMDLPIFASDGAADTEANLPSGGFYKLTGDRTVYQKP